MIKRGITPSQTVGPFFAFALTPDDYDYPALTSGDLVTPDAVGEPIRIEGRVTDGEGKPVPDAFLELWQADGAGRYAGHGEARPNAAFKGFGRSATGKDGTFAFRTVKPGQVAGPNGATQAPHINVSLFARGVLRRMFTRIYFDGETSNAGDPILALVPEHRRHTLVARRDGSVDGVPRFVFDLRLQGDDETVFFEA